MDPEVEDLEVESFTWSGGDTSNVVEVQGELSSPIEVQSVWP